MDQRAYVFGIIDWSSDVCSSDLLHPLPFPVISLHVPYSADTRAAVRNRTCNATTGDSTMRIAKIAITAGLLTRALALAGCYNDRPGRWGDHHHRGHHGHHDRDRKSTRLNSSH